MVGMTGGKMMLNSRFLPSGSVAGPSTAFEGRMKTVREKQVKYQYKHRRDLLDSNRADPPGIVSGLTTAVPAGIGLGAALGQTAPVLGLLAGTGLGGGLLVGSTGTAYYLDRQVTYVNKQVPMTEAEEWAVMTPLEKGHSQIDKALERWASVRNSHRSKISQIETLLSGIHKEVAELTKRLDAQRLKVHSITQGEERDTENRITIQLSAKSSSQKEHEKLLETANQVFAALDAEILKREEKLLEGKERLNMMQSQQAVLEMHQQLETVRGEGSSEKGTDPLLLELEKQRVQVESVLTSLQTHLDVESTLKAMAKTGSF